MLAFPRRNDAELFARLPERLHYTGEPNDWVRVTRPGRRLHSFLEGPCWDADGNLWLVDVPYGRIFRIAPDGGWTLAIQFDGEPHALRARADGRFVLTDRRRGVMEFDAAAGTFAPLCTRTNSEAFRGVSDLALAPNGDVWFTDPGRSSLSDPTGRLFRLPAGGREPDLVLADLVLANLPYPNGVALSPDGRLVYVACTRANAVWKLLAQAPDPVYPMAGLFLQLSGGLGPDGLAVDGQGRIAVTQAQAGRVYLFNALGDPLLDIRTPGGLWTTACLFAPDGRTLYIVEAETGSVYRALVNAA